MISSAFSGTGLSLELYQSLLKGGYWISDYTEEVVGYSHELTADNWFNSASINLLLRKIDLVEFFIGGLGMHVVVRSPSQKSIFEGFVDSLSVTLGNKTYNLGNLSDIGNRVYVSYTPVYVSSATGTIVKGTSTETPLTDSTESQSIYGIIEKNLSAGECIVTTAQNEAIRFRDEFLMENSFHKIQSSYSSGGSENGIVTLNCFGYWKWLDFFVYNYRVPSTSLGWSTLSTKLQAILTANPNPVISTDYRYISANSAIAPNRENNNKTALTIIKGICAAGDASGNRWNFGIGANRIAYYRPISTVLEYDYFVNDNEQKLVRYGTTAALAPWEIEPGAWYQTNDLFKPINYSSVYSNSSASYIESVRFTAPYGFDLTEGKMSRIGQMLAAKGLGAL